MAKRVPSGLYAPCRTLFVWPMIRSAGSPVPTHHDCAPVSVVVVSRVPSGLKVTLGSGVNKVSEGASQLWINRGG